VATPVVRLTEDVEEEGVHVIVQGFVVEEELGQEADVLAIDLILVPIDFKDGDVAVPVDFIPRRVSQLALFLPPPNTAPRQQLPTVGVRGRDSRASTKKSMCAHLVPPQGELAPHELEAELAEVQFLALPKLLGEGGVVPGLDLKPPHLDPVNVLHLCRLLVLSQTRWVQLRVALWGGGEGG